MKYIYIPIASEQKDKRYEHMEKGSPPLFSWSDSNENNEYSLYKYKNKENCYILRRTQNSGDNNIFQAHEELKSLYDALVKCEKIDSKKFSIYIHWGGMNSKSKAEDKCNDVIDKLDNEIKENIEFIPYSSLYNTTIGSQDSDAAILKRMTSSTSAKALRMVKYNLCRYFFFLTWGESVESSVLNFLKNANIDEDILKKIKANVKEIFKANEYKKIKKIQALRAYLDVEIDKKLKQAGKKAVYDG